MCVPLLYPTEVPRVVAKHKVVLVAVGGDVTLQCLVTGAPPPKLHWFKGNDDRLMIIIMMTAGSRERDS